MEEKNNEEKVPPYYYYLKRFKREGWLRKTLGIKDDKDINEELESISKGKFSLGVKEYDIEEKPDVYSKNPDLIRRLRLVDPSESLIYQLKREPGNLSSKQLKHWTSSQKKYIDQLVEEENYEGLIVETEKLLRVAPKGNNDYYSLLRKGYSRNIILNKNRHDNLNKLIKLEEKLKPSKIKLYCIGKRKESELILNILEDCKEADEEMFSRMIGFVDKYYNRVTI